MKVESDEQEGEQAEGLDTVDDTEGSATTKIERAGHTDVGAWKFGDRNACRTWILDTGS